MNRRTVAVVAFLFLLCLVFYWKILFTNKHGFPWDILSYYYPSLHFIHGQLRQGHFPFWDPYVFSGFPIIGDPQAGTVYPLNYILFLFQIGTPLKYKAVECLMIFHYFLAGVFMYIFARGFRIGVFGAGVSAVTYMLSGYMVAHAQHMATLNSMAWMPLIFHFARRSLVRRHARDVIFTGLCLAMQSLIGYVQVAAYTLLALMLLYLWEAGLVLAETKKWVSLRPLLAHLALMLAVFAGTTAVLMIPTYELGNLSIRRLVDFDEAVGGVSPLHMITLVLPNFFGGLKSRPMWVPRELTETHFYLGIIPFMLYVISFRYLRHLHMRDYFWPICSVLFVLLSFGGHTYFAEAIYYLVPGFSNLHRLVNYFAVANVCMCLLAGFSVHALRLKDPSAADGAASLFSRLVQTAILIAFLTLLAFPLLAGAPDSQRVKMSENAIELIMLLCFFSAGAGLVGLYATDRLPAVVCQTLLAVLLLVDLFTYNHNQPFNYARFNPNVELTPTTLGGSSSLLQFLRQDRQSDFRIAATCGQENAPNVTRIRSINGYNPIRLKGYSEFLTQFLPSSNTVQWVGGAYNFNSPLLDLLGVKYVISCDAFHDQTKMELPGDKYELVFHDWDRVYRNKTPIHPVEFFPQALVLDDDHATFSLLNNASYFDPRRILLLSKTDRVKGLPEGSTVTPVWLKIEAENFVRKSTGTIESIKSASGGKYLGYWGKGAGDVAAYYFDLPKDLPECTFALRYCSAEKTHARLKVTVTNGSSTTEESITLSPTVNWQEEWRIAGVTLRGLKGGRNTLTLQSAGQAFVNTDSLFLVEQVSPKTGDGGARLKVVGYEPTSVRVDASVDHDGFLFLNEIYYPGWRAYVDGQEQVVHRADAVFRALYLKAGNHRVVFKFQPTSFYLGATITLLTLASLGVYFFGGHPFLNTGKSRRATPTPKAATSR